jgi:sulfide:quinone oxidoreductase
MTSPPTRVLVAGAGVAGLEAVLALKALAADRVEIELLAPGRHFTYRPLAVAEPFRAGSVQRLPLAAIAADLGVTLHRDGLARLLPGERAVETQGGAWLEYDALVLALGARQVEAIPGALSFRGPQDAGRVAEVVARLRDGAIRARVLSGGVAQRSPLPEAQAHEASSESVRAHVAGDAHIGRNRLVHPPPPVAPVVVGPCRALIAREQQSGRPPERAAEVA